MDDGVKSSILKGCWLVRHLESKLPRLVNRPDAVGTTCEEIARVFLGARERLGATTSTFSTEGHANTSVSWWAEGEAAVSGWGRTSSSRPKGSSAVVLCGGGGVGGGYVVQTKTAAAATSVDSGRGSASSSRGPARRRHVPEKLIRRVAAPEIGNAELPPDDGHTWRKYGQKSIVNSRFPRGYYRCTHQKSYYCRAKRMVQRLDEDPSTFEITYIGSHTCHLSGTAPSSSVPLPSLANYTVEHDNLMTPLSLGFRSHDGIGESGMQTAELGERETEYAVAHMADAMFNSRGAGSSNGIMDLIFDAGADDGRRDSFAYN